MDQKKRIIELALQWLGESTRDQLELERCRAQIHGLYMASIVTRNDSLELIQISRVCQNLWIDEYQKIPLAWVER